jgi:transposase InsO family protein
MLRSALPRPFYRLHRSRTLSRHARRRLQWFDFYHAHGQNARLTCRHFAISPRTFYKWLHRFNPKDLSSLEDRSRRPHRVRPSPLPQSTLDKAVALRQRFPAWSKYKLAVLLEQHHGVTLSPSTLGRIFKKHNLFLPKGRKKGLSRLKRKRERPPKAPRKAFPGSLVQMDTKHLRFSDGQKAFQFTAVDTCTRLRVLRAFSTSSSRSAERFLEETRRAFPFPLKHIQTDNGSEFLGFFDKACPENSHGFSFPRSPKQNAFVERSHKTDDDEFYHLLDEEPESVEELNHKLRAWQRTYNTVRPHASLGYLTPAAFLATLSHGDPKHPPKVFTMY